MQVETVHIEYMKKERIFKESKDYIQEVLKQINEQKIENQVLEQNNMRLHLNVSQHKMLQDQLRDVESDKKQIESAIVQITSQPFMNRGDKGQSALQRITSLEEKAIEKEK